MVSASAGFGKTTLLAVWLQTCDYPVAWLSLDERDGDTVRFLTYLVAAIQQVAPQVGGAVTDALGSSQQPPLESLLTALLNDLANVPEPFVLVLDDYHLLDATPIDDALAFLLDHLPSQVHLVIATREDPQLPLTRLRVRGQLNELRAADLRFTADEAAHFLNQAMGLDLSTEAVAALEARTEGWIAGLQLAALSMQGRDDPAAFVEAFTGSHRFVLDYLLDEVLRRQPEAVRQFMLQTAVLDRLSAPLCDAVREGEGSRDMLATLERDNLFLVPLDDTRQWYRYHHLFADALYNTFRHEQPDAVPTLHRRACDWYDEHDLPYEAIHHALAGENYERAADLIEYQWPLMDESYQTTVWLRWARTLPEELVRTRPMLCHGFGRSLLYDGDLDMSEAWFAASERALNAASAAVDSAQVRRLSTSLSCARAYRAMAEGDLAATRHHAQQALATVEDDDILGYVQATVFFGLAEWAEGNLATADETLSAFIARMQTLGRYVDAIELVVVIADMRIACGQLRRAHRLYQDAFRLLSDRGDPHLIGKEDLYRGVVDLYCEWNRLDDAADSLATAEKLGEIGVIRPDWYHRLNVTAARLKIAGGDLNGGLLLLDEAERHYIRSPLPPIRPVEAHRARVWIRQGMLEAAGEWARSAEVTPDTEITYLREFEVVTLARLLIAHYRVTHDDDTAATALDLLERLQKAAEDGGRTGSLIEILMLQALLVHALGDTSDALPPLERALTLAAPEGYVRTFLDEGEPLAALLREVATHNITPDETERLLLAFDTDAASASPQDGGLIDPLSDRELDVLHLLTTELSGPEIADKLTVSLNTIRTHTKNIYSKLGVGNRRAAVHRARELGII